MGLFKHLDSGWKGNRSHFAEYWHNMSPSPPKKIVGNVIQLRTEKEKLEKCVLKKIYWMTGHTSAY